MIPSGLPELTSIQDLKYVRDALQPQLQMQKLQSSLLGKYILNILEKRHPV